MPVLFLAHGAPPLLDDAEWVSELAAWSKALPKPTAVLMLSAHWEQQPLSLGATAPVPLVYDFYGFPRRYYEMQYPAPGAPRLAQRLRALLDQAGVPHRDEPDRGLDHGAYVPLVAMYPKADVPVLQVSLPSLQPQALYRLGALLKPLRDEGVLIIGSGFITHNLRRAFSEEGVASWAREFDDWSRVVLERHDVDGLLDFEQRGPGAQLSLPTTEHFVPLIAAAGAAPDEKVTFPITGWWMNKSFSRRSVQLG